MHHRLLTLIVFLLCTGLLLAPGDAIAQSSVPSEQLGEPLPPAEPHRPPVHMPKQPSGGQPEAVIPGKPAATFPNESGGPDEFGYTWDNAVAFNWIDATTGADTGMGGDCYDNAVGPIELPFPFRFYEETYSELWIAGCGYLSFIDNYYWPEQQHPFPDFDDPNAVIAPFWTVTHLENAGPEGRIYYKSGGTAPNRYFVVEWHDVAGGTVNDSSDGDELYRFEVILSENGDIRFQYHSMLYNDWRYYASIGIEDEMGFGLGYMNWDNYWERLPTANQAVLFDRPAPSARVQIFPRYYGKFTAAGQIQEFLVPIRNTGELGADTYDLSLSSTWPVSLYAPDGSTLLTDTDSDGVVDTGMVTQDEVADILVKVQTPGDVVLADQNTVVLTATSSLNTSKSKNANLQTTVPAPFAQIFRDDADGAMSLYLAQPKGQAVRKLSPDDVYGSYPAIAELPNSFINLWTDYRSTGNWSVREIYYTLQDNHGKTELVARKLTNHPNPVYETYDYDPAVAVAPNGLIGVLWYRYMYDIPNDLENYNIFFAILNSQGDLIFGPSNLTNNNVWGTWDDFDIPAFYDPRIVATGDNHFFLVWNEEHEEVNGWVEDIYYTIRDTSGGTIRPITNLTNVDPESDLYYYSPALAQLEANRVLLGWSQYDGIAYAVLDSAGNVVHPATPLGWYGSDLDAVQLSTGRILLAWTNWDELPQVSYALLDGGSYNFFTGPNLLANPAALAGDYYVSATADHTGHAILTWMDASWGIRQNLYYALIGDNGEPITPATIFTSSQAHDPSIISSYDGYGNTSYRWIPPDGVDGLAGFLAPNFSSSPGDLAAVKVEAANYGATKATNVALTATLDSQLTYMGDSSGITPSIAGNQVTWNLPDLVLLDSIEFTLYVQTPDGVELGTSFPVSLELTSDGPEANPGDNTANAQVRVVVKVSVPLVYRSN